MLQGNCPPRIRPLLRAYDALAQHEALHGKPSGSVAEDLRELLSREIYEYAARTYPCVLRAGYRVFRPKAFDYLEHRKPRPRFQLWLLRRATEISEIVEWVEQC